MPPLRTSSPGQQMAGTRVLVTGGAGFVGSQLVRRLLHLGCNVACLIRDHDPSSPLWFSGDIHHVTVIDGDLEQFADVKRAIVSHEFDVIFHLGAQALVGAARLDPLATFESNIRGTYHILEACRLYGRRVRVVTASSDKAYGECESLPYRECTPLAGRNPYDVSKSCADLIAQSYAHSYELCVAIARCGNIFGPGDLHWNRLIPGTIRSIIENKSPIIRSDGTPVRDYMYVEDAVDAYLALAEWLGRDARTQQPCAFNFSSSCSLSVLEMTRLIQRICAREDLEPIVNGEAPGEIQEQRLDISRAMEVLHWSPRHTLEVALRETVLWYNKYLSRQLHSMPMPGWHAANARSYRAIA